MNRSDKRIPPAEIQPDPQLRLSDGRATGMQITLVAIACMVILGLMIYGLGRPDTDGAGTVAAPPSQETTGAPPTETAAPQQGGGNVAGGENAPPKTEAAPQNQPAQEPVPQQTKPGAVEDDSKR